MLRHLPLWTDIIAIYCEQLASVLHIVFYQERQILRAWLLNRRALIAEVDFQSLIILVRNDLCLIRECS
jgi:hypothetical protein